MYRVLVRWNNDYFGGGGKYQFCLDGPWYSIEKKYKIGQRLIAFYKMAEGDANFAPPLVVPVEDEADLYKLFPTKRGRETIDRFIERSKKELLMKSGP